MTKIKTFLADGCCTGNETIHFGNNMRCSFFCVPLWLNSRGTWIKCLLDLVSSAIPPAPWTKESRLYSIYEEVGVEEDGLRDVLSLVISLGKETNLARLFVWLWGNLWILFRLHLHRHSTEKRGFRLRESDWVCTTNIPRMLPHHQMRGNFWKQKFLHPASAPLEERKTCGTEN